MRSHGTLLALVAALGCGGRPATGDAPGSLGKDSKAIVYGDDDRMEVFAYSDSAVRERARTSAVALIPPQFLRRPPSGQVTVSASSLGQTERLCDGERFAEQTAGATCSATLIDDDLVLTAGHCFERDDSCDIYAYVFDYFYRSESELEPLTEGDVYRCRNFLVRSISLPTADSKVDYAIVQLDRPALAPRSPVRIASGSFVGGDSVVAIGFPDGLPAKVDGGGTVIDPRTGTADYFTLDSDTFEGSSGSGVYNLAGELMGVLVRGGDDYERVDGARCQTVIRIPEGQDGSPWEQATYARRAVEALCDSSFPSLRLCGRAPRCGDGFCTMDEVGGTCALDCAQVDCARPPCAKDALPYVTAGDPAPESPDGRSGDALPAGALPKSKGCSLGHPFVNGPSLAPWLALLGLLGRFVARRLRRGGGEIGHAR